jgi:hypothetical protein
VIVVVVVVVVVVAVVVAYCIPHAAYRCVCDEATRVHM